MSAPPVEVNAAEYPALAFSCWENRGLGSRSARRRFGVLYFRVESEI